MIHKIIHTPNYLLVVDDSKIKKGDKSLLNIEGFEPTILTHHEPIEEGYQGKKIIAHLPLNNSPILEGVDLLAPLEQDDVDELAKEYGEDIGNKDGTSAFDYKRGYNKAKEKYKYTEEDVRKAIFLYAGWITGGMPSLKVAKTAEERLEQIFQSLSQPKVPVAFECDVKSFEQEYRIPIREVRITTPEGHTQWIGKYIY